MLAKYYDSLDAAADIFNTFKVLDEEYFLPASRLGRSFATARSSSYRTEIVDDRLVLSVDVPGVKSTDLSVQVTGREVKVSGKLRGADFKHEYRLSKVYDPETIDASLEDGVLALRFSKAKDSQTRSVEVKVK